MQMLWVVNRKQQHIGKAQMKEQPMKLVLQLFRGATITQVVRSISLATSATGGVLQSSIQNTPGTGIWKTKPASCTGMSTSRIGVVPFVVSRISNLFD